MDDDSYYGCSHRHKRTRTRMDGDGASSAWGTPYRRVRSTSEESSSSTPHRRLAALGTLHTRPQRYTGDGMDYRRPIASTSARAEHAVIDLTEDDAGPSRAPEPVEHRIIGASRPPRYHREIIDIEDIDASDHPTLRASERTARVPESPEVEFISSRTIDPPRRPPPNPRLADVDLTDEDFEMLEVMQQHQRDRNPFGARAHDLALGQQMGDFVWREDVRQRLVGMGGLGIRRLMRRGADLRTPEANGRERPIPNIVQFAAPQLDFTGVGFDLGLERERPPPPPPTYKKPDAAPKGFTRSPVEDEVLICPNCGDELCTGNTDLKKQVWIAKACGHVYCGECTENRFVTGRKLKEKSGLVLPPAFRLCVVEGCEKKVQSRTAMIQVYL